MSTIARRCAARCATRGVHVIQAYRAYLADPGAESAWETWLRYLVLRAGLPRPTTQLRVRTPHGEFRADLGWEAFRLLAEFDGRARTPLRLLPPPPGPSRPTTRGGARGGENR